MKRTQIRALTLAILLTLTLCLLPAAAGAYHLKPEKLEFIVGEYDELNSGMSLAREKLMQTVIRFPVTTTTFRNTV